LQKLLNIVGITIVGCLALYFAQTPSTTAKAAPIRSTGSCQFLHAVHVGNTSYISCLSIVGHPLAESSSPQGCPSTGKGPSPNCVYYGPCPTGRVFTTPMGINDTKFAGPATNNCGFQLNRGAIELSVDNDCPGVSPGIANATASVGTWPNGVTHNYSFTAEGRCEV